MEELSKQETLLKLNVNEFTDKKGKLTYLSWVNAWGEFMKVYPNATYTVKKNQEGTPVFGNSKFGYMVYTTVTAGDITREMWLFVMDGANKALKDDPYEYTTKYGKKNVDGMTMFDVNKTVMRCLTKNLAMFGLGLYIYAGEDLPEDNQQQPKQNYEVTDIKQLIFNALNHVNVPKADRDKYFTGLKSKEVLINQETLDKIIMEYNL